MRSPISRCTSSPDVTPDAVHALERQADQRLPDLPPPRLPLQAISVMVPACGASKRAAPESSARKPSTRSRRAYSPQIENATSATANATRKRGVSPHRHRARERDFAQQLLALRVDCLLPKELGRHRDRIMAAESASANYVGRA